MQTLLRAVSQKNIVALRHALHQGASVNQTDAIGWTPLYYAFLHQDQESIALLRRFGAQMNILNHAGYSMLGHVCMSGNETTARCMLRNGVPVNQPNKDGKTPLHLAVIRKNFDPQSILVARLLKRNADPNRVADNGLAPLHYAVMSRDMDTASLLLSYGANPNLYDASGASPLFYACRSKDTAMTLLLLSKGGKLDFQHLAAHFPSDDGLAETTKIFKVLHASPKAWEDSLVEEIRKDPPHLFSLQLLLKHITHQGKKPQALLFTRENALGMQCNPLQFAVLEASDTRVVRLILAANPKLLNVSEPTYGWTPLHLAAMHQKIDTVKLLMQAGARLDLKDNHPTKNKTFDAYIRNPQVQKELQNLCHAKRGKWQSFLDVIGEFFSDFSDMRISADSLGPTPPLHTPNVSRDPFSSTPFLY